ncbi:unnamed protein product [Cladocopium goreaui]|uniref:Cilia- and flagella-associated protein 77 n=1 Tax=Cladocopium goreaui TaxID=2562237 RepID=A0A9P1BXX8_9DINO|nr:unnamed protein product [Cladocopium goreaui]
MFWASHVPRPKPGPDCQDFRKLNRTAAKCGVRNARDLAEFRKHTDIKLVPPGPMGVLPKVIPSDVIPSFAYGSKSRPSTPITHVIGNQYATESEEARCCKDQFMSCIRVTYKFSSKEVLCLLPGKRIRSLMMLQPQLLKHHAL